MADGSWADRDEGDSEWLLGWFARKLEDITLWTALGIVVAGGVLTGLGALIGRLLVVIAALGSESFDLSPGGSSALLLLAMALVVAAGIAAGLRVVRWLRATDRPADRLAGVFTILGVVIPVLAACDALNAALPDRIANAVGGVGQALLLASPLWIVVRAIIESCRKRRA